MRYARPGFIALVVFFSLFIGYPPSSNAQTGAEVIQGVGTVVSILKAINDLNRDKELADRLGRIEAQLTQIRQDLQEALKILSAIEKRQIEEWDRSTIAEVVARMQIIDTLYRGRGGWREACRAVGKSRPQCSESLKAEIERKRDDLFLATAVFWNKTKNDYTKLPTVVMAMGYDHFLLLLTRREDRLDPDFQLFSAYLRAALADDSPLNQALAANSRERAVLDAKLRPWENKPTYCQTGQRDTNWNDHTHQTCSYCRVQEVSGNRASLFPLGRIWWAESKCWADRDRHDHSQLVSVGIRLASYSHPPVLDGRNCSEYQPCAHFESLRQDAAIYNHLDTEIMPGLEALKQEVATALTFAQDARSNQVQITF